MASHSRPSTASSSALTQRTSPSSEPEGSSGTGAAHAEPANWQVTGTDTTASLQVAGAPGVRSYQGGAPTNLPIVLQVDNFVARPVQ